MKFSTIGTSWITESFINATKEAGGTELISVYSRSNETAKAFAEKHGAEGWFTDLDEMLAGPSDFIYVASPNVFHFEHTMKCIEKGKHVFCEKPMVYTEEQWKEIEQFAKEKDVFVFEGYRHLFSPNYTILKENIQKAGPIRSVSLQYNQYSSRYDSYLAGERPNVFTKEFAGGALMDLGVYPLSVALDLFGEPEAIKYFPVLLSNGIDGSGTLVLTYESFVVTILCSKITEATIPSEIHGEDGSLTMDHVAQIGSLVFHDHRHDSSEELAGSASEFDMVFEFEAFVEMVTNKDKASHEKWLERSRQVGKWTEVARKEAGILFPGE